MLVNEKTNPLLTVVLVTHIGDTTFERRLNNLFSMRVPGLDVVLVSDVSIEEKFQNYIRQIPQIRTVVLSWSNELDLFQQSFTLCRGDYFHLSVPGYFINGAFFEKAVQHLNANEGCNLVYCRPMRLDGDVLRPACASVLSTENYLQVTRAAVSIYLSNQDNFELNGVIRAAHLELTKLRLSPLAWKKSLLFELACKGYCHLELESHLLLTEHEKVSAKTDIGLLRNQLRSIWTNFDKPKYRWLLSMSAIHQALLLK